MSTNSGAERRPRLTCWSSTASMAAGASNWASRTTARFSSATGGSASAPQPSPADVPWGDLGCDIVLECTGKFLKPDQLQGYFDRGVRKVIVAAPVKDAAALNVVVGVNDDRYDPERHRLLTAASCTTNCLAPVVKVVHEAIGIRHGQITTIHDPTNTNVVVDCAAQGPAARAFGDALAATDDDGQRDGHRADLSGAEGPAERPRRPRAGAERLADRLRVRAAARRRPQTRSTQLFQRPRRGRSPASSASRRGRWSPPTTPTTPAAPSSTPRARW